MIGRNSAAQANQVHQCLGSIFGQIGDVFVVISWHHQDVNGMLRRNVIESYRMLRFGDERGGNVTAGYLAENTVANLLTPFLKVYLALVVETHLRLQNRQCDCACRRGSENRGAKVHAFCSSSLKCRKLLGRNAPLWSNNEQEMPS